MLPILSAIAVVVGLVIWYIFYGLECYMNGASTWANRYLMPFQCLWQEIGWLAPWGDKARADFVRDEVIGLKYLKPGRPVIQGYIAVGKGWEYEEVVKNNSYLECANDILPGWGHFLFTHVAMPLAPLALVIFACWVYR